uniref:(California timema) hypothetical protein n=1 Tax=Timema californicum TaxID=61474 RepID=A0A7R9P513_TIMCA|nr:unnamed protein product [Timema californicum]
MIWSTGSIDPKPPTPSPDLPDQCLIELEEALLTDGAEDSGSSLLQELIVRLLCGCLGNNEISTFNYQMFLRRLFRQKCQEYGRDNPFNTDMDFQFLPLRTKVEILHALCDFRLDGEDVQDLLKNLESDSLRVEPLGHDENNSAFWYFYGTRLYREDFPKNPQKKKPKERRKKGREDKRRKKLLVKSPAESESDEGPSMGTGIWQVICFTEEDWDKVTVNFKDSISKTERSLYRTLSEDFLPEIPRLFAEKERLQRKNHPQFHPTEIRTSISPSSAVELNTTSALANYAIEAGSPIVALLPNFVEYQPRRQSSRLEKLKQQKEEEEKVLRREEEMRLQQEREAREIRERLHQQGEREKRIMVRSHSCTNSDCDSTGSFPDSFTDNRSTHSTFVGRQTNNSLASATGQIVIQGKRRKLRSPIFFFFFGHFLPWPVDIPRVLDSSSPGSRLFPSEQGSSSKEQLLMSHLFKQTVEDLQTGLYKILNYMKKRKYAWPFSEPVDEEYAPRYYSIILKPMDLRRMEDKLDDGCYQTFADFKADFQLIVDNCRQYNGTDNEYTEMVGKLQEAFQYAVDRYLESDPSSDDEIAVEFPTSATETHSQAHSHKHRGHRRKKKSKRSSPAPDSPRSSVCALSVHSIPSSDTERGGASEREESRVNTARTVTEPEDVRPLSRASSNRKRKKTGVIKNAAAIEALELATEQTLKDINKWLDDTPRFSEFSSASNSPSHFITADEYDLVGSRIENEFRRNLKLERPVRPNKDSKEGAKRRLNKDPTKQQRRREIQRTIDRLQPGKSKGNLISNMQSANKPTDDCNLLGKAKDKANSLIIKNDETAPKLSLGTVLASDVMGFGVGGQGHNFDEESKDEELKVEVSTEDGLKLSQETLKCSSPEPQVSESSPIKKEKESDEQEKADIKKDVKEEKPTPNLSAWFKAFGAPKTAPLPKKKPEVATKEEVVKMEEIKVPPNTEPPPVTADILCVVEQKTVVHSPSSRCGDDPLSPASHPSTHQTTSRQRRVSTGSSMSERSSFSQDLMDPMDGSSPRLTLDERLGGYPGPYPSPLHRSPMASPQGEDILKPAAYPPINGTIRVGFYQDTSSTLQKNSPDKTNSNSPRDQGGPASPFPSYTPRMYPPSHDPGGFQPYRSPSSPIPTYESVPPYGVASVMQYYDTTKSLTEQYRAARTQPGDDYVPSLATSSVSSPSPSYVASSQEQSIDLAVSRPLLAQKPPAAIFPVKKRLYSEMESGISPKRPVSSSLMASNSQSERSQSSPLNLQDPSERLHQSSPVFTSESQSVLGRTHPVSPLHQVPVSHLGERLHSNSSMQQHHQTLASHLYSTSSIVSTGRLQQTSASVSQPSEKVTMTSSPLALDASLKSANRLHLGTLPNLSMTQISSRLHQPPMVYTSPVMSDRLHQTLASTMSAPQSLERLHQNVIKASSPSTSTPLSIPHPTNKLHQTSAPHTRPSITPSASCTLTERHRGADAGYHRGPFSPVPPFSCAMESPIGLRGNLASIPHIIERFPGDERLLTGSPYFTEKSLGSPHVYSQNVPTTMQAPVSSPMTMFTQPSVTDRVSSPASYSTILSNKVSEMQAVFTRSVAQLPPMLSNKTTTHLNVPSAYSRVVSELSAIIPGKGSSPLNVPSPYGHAAADLSVLPGKETSTVGGHQVYNHPSADLLASKVSTAINIPSNYSRPTTDYSMLSNKQVPTSTEVSAPKVSRKRKTKQTSAVSVTSSGETSSVTGSTAFQQYIGVKTATDASPIALKTASIVPGSAFNFGPSPSALGLYGDKDGYSGFLEEYRTPTSGYFVGTDPNRDKTSAPTSPFPFLSHPQPRPPTYPFMNHPQSALVDSASYQQYLQRHQEELLRHSGVLHQGLLPPGTGYPPGYHPPIMRQPYDSLNRPSWL